MRFTLERILDPEIEPVTLAEMKLHLREFSGVSDLDAEITALITAGREWAENYTGRALIDQKWRLSIGDYASPYASTSECCREAAWRPGGDGSILLHKSPALAITSFVSVDTAGDETAVPAADYELRDAGSKWPRVMPLNGAAWTVGPLRVEFRAGYADQTGSPQTGAEVVPERYKQAIKLWVEAYHDRDERMMGLLLDTAERLIRPEMVDISLA